MFERSAVNYIYDGSLYGFMCCVFLSFKRREIPSGIFTLDDEPICFLENIWVENREDIAQRVAKGISEKLTNGALNLIKYCFLSDLPDKEVCLLEFLHYCFKNGKSSPNHIGDERVVIVHKAAERLKREAHNFKGFIRFTQRGGVLVSEINPCCRVLPLISKHFRERFANEKLMIIDNTHKDVLLQSNNRSAIYPFDSIVKEDEDELEGEYADLWRCFFKTIAIEQRKNYRCQLSHLPKRFRKDMTEFN